MKKTTEKNYQERINKVLLYIQQHLGEDVSLESLANVACFSVYHFHRIFRGIVGESIKEHTRRLKLERSVWQLQRTKQSILHIALQAGFETHESYTRALQKMFHKNPSEIRLGKINSPLLAKKPSDINLTGELTINVTIKTIDPIKVAFIRHIGPYSEAVATWDKLKNWAAIHNLDFANTLFIGVAYDDPDVTPTEKLRYDACLSINKDIKPEGEVGVQTLHGGEYAVVTHKGPYHELAGGY